MQRKLGTTLVTFLTLLGFILLYPMATIRAEAQIAVVNTADDSGVVPLRSKEARWWASKLHGVFVANKEYNKYDAMRG